MTLSRPWIPGFLTVCIGIVLVGSFGWWQFGRVQDLPTEAIVIPPPPPVDPDLLVTLLPRDAIPAIDDPQFETAVQAQRMTPGERVIALEINGDARAYPINILSSHEIVNDVVGGQPVAITWCPLCYSALVFKREVDGRVLSKRQTCETFSCGNYSTNPRGSYDVDPYASYYATAEEGVVNRQIPRETVTGAPKQRVLGVRLGETARAYPYAILAEERVINDVIDGQPVVIWFDPRTESGAAFERTVEGMVLEFLPDSAETAIMRDTQTFSMWSGLTGEGQQGWHTGSRLAPLVATPAFEFGWYGYFPHSDTYMQTE